MQVDLTEVNCNQVFQCKFQNSMNRGAITGSSSNQGEAHHQNTALHCHRNACSDQIIPNTIDNNTINK